MTSTPTFTLKGTDGSNEVDLAAEAAVSPKGLSNFAKEFVRMFPTSRSSDRGDIAPSCAQDLRQFMRVYDLQFLEEVFNDLGVENLEDLQELDIQEILSRLPKGRRLKADQRGALCGSSIQKFRDSVKHATHKKLFVEVSRLHHYIFLSHFKVEAGTEAALMRSELEHAIAEDSGSSAHGFDVPVFLDSENLNNLENISTTVRNTHNLVLLLTKSVLSRPWCLVEIVTARREGVNVRLVNVQKPGGVAFNFPDDPFYDALRAGKSLGRDAIDVLDSCNCDLRELEDTLKDCFKQIAIPYSPHKAGDIRKAEVHKLLQQCELKLQD